MSNVKFGNPSPKVSVEKSYRGIGRSHMVLQKRAMKDTCSSLSWDWLPLSQETGTQVPHGHSFQQLWWTCSPVLRRSDRWATGCLWFVCEIEVGWQFQVSWHLQRLGTSKWKVLCWKVGTWRRWRQVIPVPAFGQPSIILRSTWITLVTCTTWNAMISPLRLLTQSAISEESFFVSCVWLRAVCNLCNPWLCE